MFAEHTNRVPILVDTEVCLQVGIQVFALDIPSQSVRPHWPLGLTSALVIPHDAFDLGLRHTLAEEAIDTVLPHSAIPSPRFIRGTELL